MSFGSPVVDRLVLTRHLRALRFGRGVSQESVARALEWSLSKFARIENGVVKISKTDLQALLRHYDVEDEELIAELIDLARGARAVAWWHQYRIEDKFFETYIGYECSASTIKMSQGLIIPGLLQTERYARAVAASFVPEDQVEDVVNLRLARQQVVSARNPRQEYVIDEAVIRRQIADAMPEQLHHIIELNQGLNIAILIIPLNAGPHFGMRGPFTLLEFEAGLEDILFLESSRRGDLLISSSIEEPASLELMDEIAAHRDGFEQLKLLALDATHSNSLMEQIAQEI